MLSAATRNPKSGEKVEVPAKKIQLAGLLECTHLKELDISGISEINDDFVPTLSKFTFLQKLQLGGTPISNQGLESLRAALPNTDIR